MDCFKDFGVVVTQYRSRHPVIFPYCLSDGKNSFNFLEKLRIAW
jgi:hypothetical protein